MSTPQKARTRETRERSRRRIIEAATELVRERSYAELNVGEIMERAGIGRTIFYRHFDDLGDLLLRAGREAIDELLTAQLALAQTRVATGPDDIRKAM
jgi:AcrR family transcriptional regulator